MCALVTVPPVDDFHSFIFHKVARLVGSLEDDIGDISCQLGLFLESVRRVPLGHTDLALSANCKQKVNLPKHIHTHTYTTSAHHVFPELQSSYV